MPNKFKLTKTEAREIHRVAKFVNAPVVAIHSTVEHVMSNGVPFAEAIKEALVLFYTVNDWESTK